MSRFARHLLVSIVGLASIVSLAILVSGSTLFFADQDRDAPQPPVFRTEANYVRVDVYPTLNGQPVTDLLQEDFELLDEKVPQRIEAFQHVSIRAGGPQETRREPNTVAESRAMVQDPEARLFIVFLDTYHVDVGGSHNIRKPLTDALDRMIGQNDLVGVMTPEMSAGDITFARRLTTIEGMLSRHWNWGEREQLNSRDPVEDQYRACYPGERRRCPDGSISDDTGIYAALIDRRREKRTLDALEDLARFLRGLRDERKAILLISDGWLLFRPDQSLQRVVHCQPPTGLSGGPRVDPGTGKLTTRAPQNLSGANPGDCERDRMQLAQIDDDQKFRDILGEANRANASFYSIDPRGLAVFDTPIMPVNGPSLGAPAPMVPPSADMPLLQARLASLRTLADATDGLAILGSNDLAGGLKRVVSDLTSYYLLGYYSTGKLDGKFHAITVRVKRPGVQVRARRGYQALTAAEARTTGTAAARSPEAVAAAAEAGAIQAAIGALSASARAVPLQLHAAAHSRNGVTVVWAVGEVDGRSDEWKNGGEASLTLVTPTGETVATGRAEIPPGRRTFRAELRAAALAPGDYVLRVRAKGAAPVASPINEAVAVPVAAAPHATGALYLRSGASTMGRDEPTADLRFRRGEQIRVEVLSESASSAAGRLLDRTGKVMPVPVAVSGRQDGDGSQWITAQLALAPLGPGDYLIELTGVGAERRLIPFRVIP
jgi:VWFA-related protein